MEIVKFWPNALADKLLIEAKRETGLSFKLRPNMNYSYRSMQVNASGLLNETPVARKFDCLSSFGQELTAVPKSLIQTLRTKWLKDVFCCILQFYSIESEPLALASLLVFDIMSSLSISVREISQPHVRFLLWHFKQIPTVKRSGWLL